MAAYIRFYQFDASPFGSGNAKPGMVLGTKSLRGALAKVKQGLEEDSPRICLTGSAGVGKTSFSRALPKLLSDSAQVAVILDPRKPWREIRAAIAKRFDLQGGAISRKALLSARDSAKQLVLVIDQAEALSHESLDHLDILLQYKCDDDKQLLHCVMLADLDAAAGGTEIPLLWWLDKFTTLQLQFSPIPAEGLRHYVEKHLAKAGWAGGELFTEEALVAIHRNTGGVPRAINELCEKILIEGGMRGINSISADFIEALCSDTANGDGDGDGDGDGGAAVFEIESKPAAELSGTRAPESSADLSQADFAVQPTAQEMLDDDTLSGLPSETETRDAREQLLAPVADISSLLITQDSAESLQVGSVAPTRSEETSNLELEVEPTTNPVENFYENTQTIGAPVGMTRSSVSTPTRRSPFGTLVGMAIAASLAYALYTQVSVPTRLIESAEVKIAEVIEKQTGLGLKPAAEPAQQVATESSLAPSILDRVDILPADPDLDIVELPESKPAQPGAEAATGLMAETALEQAKTPGTDGREEVDRQVAATSGMESEATTNLQSDIATTSPASSKPATTTAAATKTRTRTTTIVTSTLSASEPVVLNEYTAIPDAASSGPIPQAPAKIAPASVTRTVDSSNIDGIDRKVEAKRPSPAVKAEPKSDVKPDPAVSPATSPGEPSASPTAEKAASTRP